MISDDDAAGQSTSLGRPNLWTLDEYVVVADLYLRRGRSSGVRDKEVVELSTLTGRSPASISRRLGNFDGTARPGMGLKPVTGDALDAFVLMRDDTATRRQMAVEARVRLQTLRVPAEMAGPQFVDPEHSHVESVEVDVPAEVRGLRRQEAQLVRRYINSVDPDGLRLRGVLIPVEGANLRIDLFDVELNMIIEAKSAVDREHMRFAVGQLLDYQRYLIPHPAMAVLLPAPVPRDLKAFLDHAGVASIWEGLDGDFSHSLDG